MVASEGPLGVASGFPGHTKVFPTSHRLFDEFLESEGDSPSQTRAQRDLALLSCR